jgi:hypothetical protein
MWCLDGTSVRFDERSLMRSDDRAVQALRPLVEQGSRRLSCSCCPRSVETDVLSAEQLLAALGWARVDGQVLCVSCQRASGRPVDLAGRIEART